MPKYVLMMLSSYQDRRIRNTETFKMEKFAKKIMPECMAQPEIFSEQGRFCENRVLR